MRIMNIKDFQKVTLHLNIYIHSRIKQEKKKIEIGFAYDSWYSKGWAKKGPHSGFKTESHLKVKKCSHLKLKFFNQETFAISWLFFSQKIATIIHKIFYTTLIEINCFNKLCFIELPQNFSDWL